jgi:hypothetical protein
MHWTGKQSRAGFRESGIALKGHATFWACAGLVANHAFAHWAKVLRRLWRFAIRLSRAMILFAAWRWAPLI